MTRFLGRLLESFFVRLRRQVSVAVDATEMAANVRRLQDLQDLRGAVAGLSDGIERVLELRATEAAEREALIGAVRVANEAIEALKAVGLRALEEATQAHAGIEATHTGINAVHAEINAVKETLFSLQRGVERIEQRDEIGRDELLTAFAPVEARIIGLGRRLEGLEADRRRTEGGAGSAAENWRPGEDSNLRPPV